MDLIDTGNPEDVLWRYMDISKFLDLLLNKQLAFPRFDRFEDPYEGYVNNFLALIKEKLIENNFSDENIEFSSRIYADSVAISNYYSYISCWHLNEYESAAMWKLYCESPESLAIKTNVHSLTNSLIKTEKHKKTFSKVTYDSKLSNYNIKDIRDVNVTNPLLMKRESFEHEKEYRVIMIDESDRFDCINDYHVYQLEKLKEFHKTIDREIEEIEKLNLTSSEVIERTDSIIKMKYSHDSFRLYELLDKLNKEKKPILKADVDLNILINEVIVSPHSPKWFFDVVNKLIKSLGFNLKVTQSELYELR